MRVGPLLLPSSSRPSLPLPRSILAKLFVYGSASLMSFNTVNFIKGKASNPGSMAVVRINKQSGEAMGISIRGSPPVISVLQEGPVQRSGELALGDELLAVC